MKNGKQSTNLGEYFEATLITLSFVQQASVEENRECVQFRTFQYSLRNATGLAIIFFFKYSLQI